MVLTVKVYLLLFVTLFASLANYGFSLYEDQVGLMDWRQQYLGKAKHALFHSSKSGRKRVVVSTEENVIASLDLRHGEIFWRHVLGSNDSIDGIEFVLGKYVVSLSSEGNFLRAWNLPDGQMVWETFLQGTNPSKSLLLVPKSLKANQETVILVFGSNCLHAVSSLDGEVIWKIDLTENSVEIQKIIQHHESDTIYAVGFSSPTQFDQFQINVKSGELVKHHTATFSGGFSGELVSVSDDVLVTLDATKSNLVIINLRNGEIGILQTPIAHLIDVLSGSIEIVPSKLSGLFAVKVDSRLTLVRVKGEGELEVVDKIHSQATLSEALLVSEGQHAAALVQHEGSHVRLTVKLIDNWSSNFIDENIVIDGHRGTVQKVFLHSYIRTDRSHGFRALLVMEDHSLLLVQQGEVVWSREDGLASIVNVVTSELPVEKKGVSIAKVEHNLIEWLQGHLLKLKGTLMIASPEDVAAIQNMRLKSTDKSKMSRDHNGFRKLLIVLTKSGKLFALHSGDGRIVWSRLLQASHKSEACPPRWLNIYQWQDPHHRAMDENPSVLVVGRCGQSMDGPGLLSFVDTYTGREIRSSSQIHSVLQVIPLPFTDSTEQRLHILIDAQSRAHLYPQTSEAISILQSEFSNVYWYSVEADSGVIKGHSLKRNCIDVADDYCFESKDVWSIILPSETEKIIATAARKLNEVVHTQAKVVADQDVMYKYISKNLLFLATVAPKSSGEIGTTTPEDSWLVVYVIDIVNGRILHRMTHHGSTGPVHAVFSENWVVYHYFNLKAHRYEMSVVEIYDQSRADNIDVWKLIIGKHNLTSPISSYSRPEILAKSQSYFFTHSVKAISVTSTSKGITSKQLLIGTINDQILALDKRYLDPRRSINPTQAEKEEGVIPLTDSLPIIPQTYATHALQVEGLRGVVTIPAKLESTTLAFAYGVDLFFTRITPSRTYDSLTEDFSYALLLITIVALVIAIFATWVFSERKELQDKWK
ncbi:ER membrane protein complex subunit 1 isoform X1 [Cucurbita pepo subsp. pepo]|uniref:ER membrane protein complex subunit 1 isoform X1 n=1 Tax=Cucurbita pepo subsp. pepo TaxID=3664 RepID=UPI000C9D3063|nr:ER membrane protein complex subunit 1 isoform X1 [Cucurbita pepo subsp. pepo]